MITFNKPYLSGNEFKYIQEAIRLKHIAGDGFYTKKCQAFFEKKYNFFKALMTTSCTDALEMAAILLDIKEGDEVIAPSYTFVSTVNAFALRGAKIVFCDSQTNHPNIDADKIEELINEKTRVIIPVHYAGVACNMDKIIGLADKYDLFVVEDAAQAIDSYYIRSNNEMQPLGSIGHLATFSFHETKNIICGEGGMLVINDKKLVERAEIIREKGTNRAKFFRGEINKYEWVDIGSSFLPSDLLAAFLFAQLESLERIQNKRIKIHNRYSKNLLNLAEREHLTLPNLPHYTTQNGHMFYVICNSVQERTKLIEHLKENNVHAVFHYLSLHRSRYYSKYNEKFDCQNSDHFTNCLLRLPMYYELSMNEVDLISAHVSNFFN